MSVQIAAYNCVSRFLVALDGESPTDFFPSFFSTIDGFGVET